jgi:hypothetical protein
MNSNHTTMNFTYKRKQGFLRPALLAIATAMLTVTNLWSNNIQVTSPVLIGRDVSAGTNNAANFTFVQFNLSWENSWRATVPNNWDAAWVFVKFRLGTTDYRSAPGATNSGNVITVHTTRGLRVGMPVFVLSGTGAFPAGTVIESINSATTFTASSAPSINLSSNAVVRAERIWEHAYLNDAGHVKGSIGSTCSIQPGLLDESTTFDPVTNPAMGAYFYRAANGAGAFTTTGARLRWNYAAQGILDMDAVEIQVFAVETVYVPTESHKIDEDGFVESILLKGEGTNGSTSIVDSSANARVITRFGNPVISTAQSPFASSSSISFNGSSTDYLTTPASTDFDFGSGDFTIETWVRSTNITGNQPIFALAYNTGSWARAGCALTMWSGVFRFEVYNNCNTTNYYCADIAVGATTTRAINTWYHVAVTRTVNDFRLFVNGVQEGSTITWAATIPGGATPHIGLAPGIACLTPCSNTGLTPFSGFLKDLRVIKGLSLYTSNFTPPSAPPISTPNTALIDNENSKTLGGTAPTNIIFFSQPTIANDFNATTTQTLPADYPKGFNGFYSMKYEISQRQWMDFFNALTTVQRNARDLTSSTGKNSDAIVFRNNINWPGSGNATLNSGTFGDVPCNYLNWSDGAAYAAWAGLRPMSELEYEKACRGPIQPLRGRTSAEIIPISLIQTTGITNPGATSEVPTNTTANAVFGNSGSVQGPLRVGALATSTSNRAKAGASFWGIMDLGGNLSEQLVSLGSAAGRSFVPVHGNGSLSRLGNATLSSWPGF